MSAGVVLEVGMAAVKSVVAAASPSRAGGPQSSCARWSSSSRSTFSGAAVLSVPRPDPRTHSYKMVLTMAALLQLVVTLLGAPATATVCPTNCSLTDFSYPFGIGPGCSLPGFNLTCDARKRLLLGSPNVTASEAVSAIGVCVVRSVHMASGAGTFSTSWEGPGAPFAISGAASMSMFVLGCGVTATLLDRGGTGAVVGNCSVGCAGEEVMRRLPDGLCVGLGCCRIDLRVHLRAFTLNISRAGDGVSRDKLSFLVAGRDRYTFRPSDLEPDIDVDMVPPALLDWAIPDQPDCQRAMDDRVAYACVRNQSECQDSPVGGYVCRCSRGFSGKPYVVDGCTPDQSLWLQPSEGQLSDHVRERERSIPLWHRAGLLRKDPSLSDM